MFEPVSDNVSLRDRIVQRILQKIEEAELGPGHRLPSERDLAQEFRVSRTTVRDAMRTLAGLGVVSVQHGRGIFLQGGHGVALGNALWDPIVGRGSTVSTLFEVRRTMETAAAAWAAERAPIEQRNALVALVQRAKGGGPTAFDLNTATVLDRAFHSAVISASGNPIAARIMLNLLDLLEEVRQRTATIPGRLWVSILEHEKIAEAILARDSVYAAEQMLSHLTSVEEDIMETLNVDD